MQRRLPSSDGATLFRSPAAGALHALVADHIVQGRVLFPGAGYLEMARAAVASGGGGALLLLLVPAWGFSSSSSSKLPWRSR